MAKGELIARNITTDDLYQIWRDDRGDGTLTAATLVARVSETPHLFAAAPELYDACALDPAGVPVPELLRQVADYLNRLGGGPMEDRLRIAAENIDAALARARGEK